MKQLVTGSRDACPVRQTQGNLLPGLDTILVVLLRKLGNRQAPTRVDHRSLRSRPAQRGTGRKDQLEILIRVLVPQDAFRALKQAPQLHQRRHAGTGRRQKLLLAHAAEAQGSESRFVRDTQQVVTFHQRAHRPALAFCLSPLGALHETPAPGIRRGVAQ